MFGEIVCKCLPAFARNRISPACQTPTCFWDFLFQVMNQWIMMQTTKKTWHRGLFVGRWFGDSHGNSQSWTFLSLPQNACRFTGAPKCHGFPGWYGNPSRGDFHAFPHGISLDFLQILTKNTYIYIQSGKLTWQKFMKCSLKKEHLGRLPSTAIDSAPCFNNYHHVVLNGCGSKSLNPKAMVEILHALVTNMFLCQWPFFKKLFLFQKWDMLFPWQNLYLEWFLESVGQVKGFSNRHVASFL